VEKASATEIGCTAVPGTIVVMAENPTATVPGTITAVPVLVPCNVAWIKKDDMHEDIV